MQEDGSGRIRNHDGRLSTVTFLFIKAEEDWCNDNGGNPVMEICGHYAAALVDHQDLPVVLNSVFPAVGLEVFGHGFRWVASLQYLLSVRCALTCVSHCELESVQFGPPLPRASSMK